MKLLSFSIILGSLLFSFHYVWINRIEIIKLNDNEDKDQLKTVIGICFVFSTLTILGFYSNFVL